MAKKETKTAAKVVKKTASEVRAEKDEKRKAILRHMLEHNDIKGAIALIGGL